VHPLRLEPHALSEVMTSTMFEFFLCTHGAGIKVADKEMPRPTVENASQGARTRSSRTLPMVRPCVAAWIASSLSLLANDADGGRCVKNNPTGKSLPLRSRSIGPALARKIFRLTRRANQRYDSARLTRQEGRAHVTNARWDAVDAEACEDERKLIADGEVVWSWRPGAGAKFRGISPDEVTVARKPVTGEQL
jgi:hypothetical protein